MVWNSLLVNLPVVKSHLISTLPFKKCLRSRTPKSLHSFQVSLDHLSLQLHTFTEQRWQPVFTCAEVTWMNRTESCYLSENIVKDSWALEKALGLHFQCCNCWLWPVLLADKLDMGYADLCRASVFVSMRTDNDYVGTHSLRLSCNLLIKIWPLKNCVHSFKRWWGWISFLFN